MSIGGCDGVRRKPAAVQRKGGSDERETHKVQVWLYRQREGEWLWQQSTEIEYNCRGCEGVCQKPTVVQREGEKD